MSKTRYAVLSAIASLFVSTSLYAQSGCVDSPEAPTVFLVFVGFLGMFYGSFVLRKVLRRRDNR